MDMDAGFRIAGGRVKIGPKRSPVRTPPQAEALAREVVRRPGFELAGLMAYEGHIAGVGDRPRGNPLQGLVIGRMQSASAAELAERRAAVVAAVSAIAPLALVNGGGTGSLHTTVARAGGDRGDRRLGLLRPHPVRPLLGVHAAPGRRASPCRWCGARAPAP